MSDGPRMTFDEFVDWINGFSGERPEHIRLGQNAMNLLHEAYPEVYAAVSCSECDPFYVDEHLPTFLTLLLNNHVVMVK